MKSDLSDIIGCLVMKRRLLSRTVPTRDVRLGKSKMRKKTVFSPVAALVLSAVAVLGLAAAGCSTGVPRPSSPPSVSEKAIIPADSPKLPPRGFYMGLLPTPAEGQSFAEAFLVASKHAEFVPVWGKPTPFYKMAAELSGDWGRTFVEQYIRGNGMFPIVHMSFFGGGVKLESPPDIPAATLISPDWRKAYKQTALDIVRTARPLYLSLGNEVNRWYEQYGARSGDPYGFQHYVSLYTEIYDAVKELSPQTKVFCTFAREIVAQHREADLAVLRMFPAEKVDLLVLTSYPFAVKGIRLAADIPNDYYARALTYMPDKPLGFSELGWAALEAFGGEEGQADFMAEVAKRLTVEQGMNLHLFGWSWLSALDENDAIALIKRDGSPRLAYSLWQELSLAGK